MGWSDDRKSMVLRRGMVTGSIYLALFFAAWCTFLHERHRSWPSGRGFVFGPINYFHLSFEFGISPPQVIANVLMVMVLAALCFLPRRIFWIAASLYVVVWVALGWLAIIHECEFPWLLYGY